MAAVIAEVALRLGGYSRTYVNPLHSFFEAHSLVGYRGKPDFTGRWRTTEFDAVISHDENGFRKQYYQQQQAKVSHNILVFGDSFTWGWGVGEGKILTDQMSLLMPDYRVLNFGLNNTGTVQQFTLYEAYGEGLLQPGDTLVLMFFGNDFWNNVGDSLHAELKNGQITRVGPTEPFGSKRVTDLLKDTSYLFNLLVYSADAALERLKQSRADAQVQQLVSLADHSPEIVITKYFLEEFQKSVARKQAKFIVAYIPQQGELGESHRPSENRTKNERAYRQAFFACAQSLGIRTLDLLPYFLKARRSGLYDRFTFIRDEHWNENGHAVVAKAISEFILASDQHR
jgi:lysophospholipase L1-like esterase